MNIGRRKGKGKQEEAKKNEGDQKQEFQGKEKQQFTKLEGLMKM